MRPKGKTEHNDAETATHADDEARHTETGGTDRAKLEGDSNAAASSTEQPAFNDPLVLFLAERTDLSPNQAKALIDREGRDLHKLRRIARTMKAEG